MKKPSKLESFGSRREVFVKAELQQIRTSSENIVKTTFNTKMVSLNISSCQLAYIAPAISESLIHEIFHNYTDECLMVCIDELLILIKNRESHYEPT